MNKYSITSNEVKLYKHLDRLQLIQKGYNAPIQLHISTTNKCNQNCMHCCFSERDKKLELPLQDAIDGIYSFYGLGIKSIEFTGGGEPTLYTHINELMDYIKSINLPLGMNTNALSIDRVKDWKYFKWVRVAFNAFDYCGLDKFKENVFELKRVINKITACYIVPQQINAKNLHKVIDFANECKIYTRIAPDCIQSKDKITHTIDHIKEILNLRNDNIYVFCSDFNVYLYENKACMIHMIKPFLYTDGYVYCCPSSELAIENNRTMQSKYRVCHVDEIEEYYNNEFDIFDHKCSYCKYSLQNNIIKSLLIETENNEFV